MQTENPQELEGKWLVRDLPGIETKLAALGVELLHPRVLETNLRFDDANGSLRSSLRVLRLRQDAQARLTFKGPAWLKGGISQRTEIEFAVSDFASARAFLEALGYSICFIYEKFRCEYRWGECIVMLDELPFGDFVEIEGASVECVRAVADQLGIKWSANSTLSYSALFEFFNSQSIHPAGNLTFDCFKGRSVHPDMLGLGYADGE